MKRLFRYVLIGLIALYGTSPAFSNEPDSQQQAVLIDIGDPDAREHIALLLPLAAPALKSAALAVQNGFTAAAAQSYSPPFKVRLYPTTGKSQDILDVYQQAVQEGASMVIGPLTRSGVNALARSNLVTIPTLALNVADDDIDLPAKLYFYGLDTAAEAQHLAELAAIDSTRHHAIIIADRSELSRRLKAAFADAWIRPGNTTSAEEVEIIEQEMLSRLRAYTADSDSVVFLALNGTGSQTIRQFIHSDTPVYVTSLILTDQCDSACFQALDGVRFTDMPWLLEQNSVLTEKYDHPDKPVTTSLLRFYALGIDTFRLIEAMTQTRFLEHIRLDGITGEIYFQSPNRFDRKQTPVIFENGQIVPDNQPADPLPAFAD